MLLGERNISLRAKCSYYILCFLPLLYVSFFLEAATNKNPRTQNQSDLQSVNFNKFESFYETLSLNDDGSIFIDMPSFLMDVENYLSFFADSKIKKNVLISRKVDPKNLCQYFIGKVKPKKIPEITYVNETVYLSSFLPDHYSYFFLSYINRYKQVKKISGVDGFYIKSLSCKISGQIAPTSTNFQSLSFIKDNVSLIKRPKFKLNNQNRVFSARNNFETICQHFGFQTYVENSVETKRKYFSNEKLIKIDNQRHFSGFEEKNFPYYIKNIKCQK